MPKVQGYLYPFRNRWNEQGCYREFFSSVDIREHHVVDVGGEFHQAPLNGITGGIYLGSRWGGSIVRRTHPGNDAAGLPPPFRHR